MEAMVSLIEDCVLEENESFGVLFDFQNGRTFMVNGTGVSILRLLKNPTTLPMILKNINSTSSIDSIQRIENDIHSFITTLLRLGLVERFKNE